MDTQNPQQRAFFAAGGAGGSVEFGGPTAPGPGTGLPNPFVPGEGIALRESPPVEVTLASPGGVGLEVGESKPLSFVIHLEDGSTVAVNPGVAQQSTTVTVDGVRLEYQSLDPSVATVDAKALVTGLKIGSTSVRIKATSGQGESQATITQDVVISVGQADQFFYIASPTPNGTSGWITILGLYLDGTLKVIEDRIAQPGRPLGVFRSPDGRFVYTVNVSTNDMTAYSVTAGTGQLTRLGENIPVAAGSSPRGLAFTGDQQYAYTLGAYGQVYGFRVGSDGLLTPLPHSLPDVGGSFFEGPRIQGDRFYAVDVDGSPGGVRVYRIEPDGQLTYQSEVIHPGRAFGFDFSPDGRYAYLGSTGPDLFCYSVTAEGDLVPLTPATVTTIGSPSVVKAHPTLPVVYVGTGSDGYLNTYAIDVATGALTEIASDDASSVRSLVIDLTGRYMYGFRGDYILSTFTIAADGRPTRGEDFADRSIDNGFAGTGVFIKSTINKVKETLFNEEFPYCSVIGF